MVLVEADDDLAACVFGFFEDRYHVFRVPDLEAASAEIARESTDILFADIGSGATDHVARIEALRRRHPGLKIVVSYLALPGQSSESARLLAVADVVARKPYRVIDVDRALTGVGEGTDDENPIGGQ